MKVEEIIFSVLEPSISMEQITPEAKLVDDLGADSLDLVQIWLALEEYYEIEISDEAAEKLLTVGDFVDHIQQKGGKEKTIRLVIDCPI